MKRHVSEIWNEIRSGKNIDVYLTLAVCAIIVVLGVLGITSLAVISSAILATLILLAANALGDRRARERLEGTLSNLRNAEEALCATRFFSGWDNARFQKRLMTAKELSLIAVSNYEIITEHAEDIKAFLIRGGKLRCILVDPDGLAIRMEADRGFGAERKPEYCSMQVKMSLQRMGELLDMTSDKGAVQVKLVDHLPSLKMTILDHSAADGLAFVTLENGFAQPYSQRPSFVVCKEFDSKWFNYYQQHFENIWEWDKGKVFDLANRPN
jgi:hypothetical protein